MGRIKAAMLYAKLTNNCVACVNYYLCEGGPPGHNVESCDGFGCVGKNEFRKRLEGGAEIKVPKDFFLPLGMTLEEAVKNIVTDDLLIR